MRIISFCDIEKKSSYTAIAIGLKAYLTFNYRKFIIILY